MDDLTRAQQQTQQAAQALADAQAKEAEAARIKAEELARQAAEMKKNVGSSGTSNGLEPIL